MAFLQRVVCVILLALLLPFVTHAQSGDIRCSIKSSRASVPAGETVQLTWSSFGADSASIEGLGSVPTAGSRTVVVTESHTYRLTVKGDGGAHFSCDVAVVATLPLKPSCFISAWPASITAGQNSTVSWGSSNASSLFISGLGQVPASGTRTVRPEFTTTYALTASSEHAGACTQTTRITVHPKTSQYGYIPNVVQSLFSPLVGKSPQHSNTATTYEDTWYFDDDLYEETYDEWDDTYGDVADETYDEWTENGYGENEENLYYEEETSSEDCWWSYWCESDDPDGDEECWWGYLCDESDAEQETFYQYPSEGSGEGGSSRDPYYYDQPSPETYYQQTQPPADSWCAEYGPNSGMCGQMPLSQEASYTETESDGAYQYWETSSEYYQSYYETYYENTQQEYEI